jgi:hypothetical protein
MKQTVNGETKAQKSHTTVVYVGMNSVQEPPQGNLSKQDKVVIVHRIDNFSSILKWERDEIFETADTSWGEFQFSKNLATMMLFLGSFCGYTKIHLSWRYATQ